MMQSSVIDFRVCLINHSAYNLPTLFHFLPTLAKRTMRASPSLLVSIFIVACQPHAQIDRTVVAGSVQSAEVEAVSATKADYESQLSAELLYDILLASIAAQRNNTKQALASLSSAAYRSKDRRLIGESIRFALSINAYQQASALVQFLNQLQPNNDIARFSLAKVHLLSGDRERAFVLLTELIKDKTDYRVGLLQEIATLLSKQDQQTVLDGFITHIEKSPANEQLTLTAALLAAELNNVDEYSRLLDHTLELKADWEDPGIRKLIILSDHDVAKMKRFAEAHIHRHPKQMLFRLQYAQRLLQHHNTDAALDHLKQILRLNPDAIDALFTVGIVYLHKNFLAEAKKMLVRYLQLNAENEQDLLRNDQSRIYLADIEFQLKNYTAAESYLYSVSSPRYYLNAQIKMADIIGKRDDVDAALRHLRQIDNVNDEQRIQIILAQNMLLKTYNRLAQARLLLDESLQQYPQQPDLLYNRGLLAAQMNLLALHERDMRQVIALLPENAHAYNALGYTLADQTDRLEEAMVLISKANQLLPDDPYILDSMGWVHFRLGHHAQAIKFLRQAFRIRHDAEIAAHLGEVLWVHGNKDEAMKIWTQGIRRTPENLILRNTIKRFSQQQNPANIIDKCVSAIAGSHWHERLPLQHCTLEKSVIQKQTALLV